MKAILGKWQGAALGVALLLWISIIVGSGAGWNPLGLDWDFTNSGGFGDSFGPLSALMASIAAISAILAYNSQRAENVRLNRRQEIADTQRKKEKLALEDRENQRDHSSRIAAFERTFFNLLDTFTKITSHVDIRAAKGENKTAQDAFQSILGYAQYCRPTLSHDLNRVWQATIKKYRNDLNHYFRFMYHIVLFVDQSAVVNKYFYVRFVRSMLSESEIILLGLNCEYGEGGERFTPLVERYSLMHNISDEGREKWFAKTSLSDSAFETDDD